MTNASFSTLPLKTELLSTLDSLGYTSMTAIQQQSLPAVLEGKDVIGQGKTGSGKTATFALGLLSNLNVKRFRVQSLVLCPTRELADQVAKEIRTLARGIHNIKVLTLCGGMPMGPQIGSLEHGAHILVGTPGRILDHLTKDRINLDELNTLVLDEADRMLEMGFQEALIPSSLMHLKIAKPCCLARLFQKRSKLSPLTLCSSHRWLKWSPLTRRVRFAKSFTS